MDDLYKIVEDENSEINHKIKKRLIIYSLIILILLFTAGTMTYSAFSTPSTSTAVEQTVNNHEKYNFDLNPFKGGFSLNPKKNRAFTNFIKLILTFFVVLIALFVLMNILNKRSNSKTIRMTNQKQNLPPNYNSNLNPNPNPSSGYNPDPNFNHRSDRNR